MSSPGGNLALFVAVSWWPGRQFTPNRDLSASSKLYLHPINWPPNHALQMPSNQTRCGLGGRPFNLPDSTPVNNDWAGGFVVRRIISATLLIRNHNFIKV